MRALIDGDLVAFINSISAEGDPCQIALLRADKHIRDILEYTGCSEYEIFLSGRGNFRKEINPQYKANRTQEKPIHLGVVNKFLVDEWNAIVTEGYEADDALGCAQDKDTIICSLDKDLLMIEGKHYSWPISRFSKLVRDHSIVDVTYEDGIKHFYKQMLIGDAADNIFGINGIGKVKAAKFIDPLGTEEEMFRTVEELYSDPERFAMNAECLWIWRSLGVNFSVRSPFENT
jgi:5'-3' exonuclease